MLLGSCAKDFLPSNVLFSSNESVTDAKEQFEATATDLCEIDFSMSSGQPKTKSKNKTVITPLWNKALIVSKGKLTSFEVPLGGDIKKYASTRYRKGDLQRRAELKKITTKLILKRNNETGKYIYFIATMIGKNEDQKVKEINYIDNRSFTGHIFISNLDGLCVGIYKYFAGTRRPIRVDFNTDVENSENIQNGVTSIQMFITPAAAYNMGETQTGDCDRNPKCTECLYGGAICNICHYCYVNIPDVDVRPEKCLKCKGPYYNCYCCKDCGEYPCECQPDYGCSLCGSYSCDGGCQTPCFYCGSLNCDGSCRSPGGGGGTTDPDESCSDAKCSTCGKCINPTKPNCQKCLGHCNHEICESCNKPIKTALTRASTCTHTEYCSSNGPVCDCGERHMDADSIPKCAIPLAEGIYIYDKNAAYKIMWLETLKTGKEYAGYLLTDGRVHVNIDARNTSTISYGADYTTCKNNKFSVAIYNKGKRSIVNMVTNVHTHPQIIPDDRITSDGTITAKDLRISYDADIPTLKAMKFNYGLILNNYKVFKYYQTSSYDSAICHFVESF